MNFQQTIKKNKNLIGIGALVCVLIIIYFSGKNNGAKYVKEIKKAPYITKGVITSIESMYKHGWRIRYNFFVKENIIKGETYSGKYSEIKNLLYGKTFPVIMSLRDPSYNDILIFPKDFDEYGLTFPDSLNWVLKYK